MKRLLPAISLVAALALPLLVAPSRDAVAAPGAQVALQPWLSPPANLSTSGDYATDTFSDPWDFNNLEDLYPTDGVGVAVTDGANMANGQLTVATRNAAEIRLVMKWPTVLPWGRDGWKHPIDSGRYTRATFRMYADAPLSMAIRYWRVDGGTGVIPFTQNPGWATHSFDLTLGSNYPFPSAAGPWSGPIVRFELFRAGALSGGNPTVNVVLDWVRVHRADASQTPPANVPVPQVLTPNEEGGADHATNVRGDAWDFTSISDVASTNQIANLGISNGDLVGTTVSNDPFVELALGPELNTDRYRRLTIDTCNGGGFSLADAPGGGMVGRLAWMPRGTGAWTETQDFVVFPGCHRMTIDLATDPPAGVHDEASGMITGWRGMRLDRLRFDLNEDRGWRNVTVREIKLADDAAFSTSYPIQFQDIAGVANATADIYVTTNRTQYDGTRIARGLPVAGGVNTFTWNGTDEAGRPMPNGTYWVYIVMKAGANVGTGYSDGPVRLEKPVPSAPSYYVPLTPARLLDTRSGQGGNIYPLNSGAFTELDVTGVGGVPETGVTAVVMNVTVDAPTAAGFLSIWPSGEAQPRISNLNFVPGQTVPNLVTVKVGANGRVNLGNFQGFAHVIADVVGYYTPTRPASGGLFTPLTPSRLLDTRDGTGRGGAVGQVGPAASIDLRVTGIGGVPSNGVDAVALNVTVDQPTAPGFVTTWPTGQGRPNASSLNFVPGLTVANLVLAKVGANGSVSLFNSNGSTHLVADVVGYFSSSGGTFVPVAPDRLVDSRDGTGGVLGPLTAGNPLTVGLTGASVPAGAKGVVVNITSADTTAQAFLTAWPNGSPMPTASISNPRPGVPVPNQAYLKLGSGGAINLYTQVGQSNVVIDVFGYIM